jgi:hypothetical protein
VPSDDGAGSTDDQGRFRIAGLPASTYLLKAALHIQGGSIQVGRSYVDIGDGSSVDIYWGEVFRQRDAKVIKLGDGEESVGHSIEIPIAKLHAISGSVLDAVTGASLTPQRLSFTTPTINSLSQIRARARSGRGFASPMCRRVSMS